MNFLLDMGLAQRTVLFLRAHGFDAIHLREQQLQRLPDEQIVQKAVAENRIILTHDLDFSRIVALSRGQYPSVVTFRLADMRAPAVNHYLQEVLDRFSAELSAGALISVTEQAIRIRQLPVK
jgi:predicted nuclease of predicted toxin-antitoxin system